MRWFRTWWQTDAQPSVELPENEKFYTADGPLGPPAWVDAIGNEGSGRTAANPEALLHCPPRGSQSQLEAFINADGGVAVAKHLYPYMAEEPKARMDVRPGYREITVEVSLQVPTSGGGAGPSSRAATSGGTANDIDQDAAWEVYRALNPDITGTTFLGDSPYRIGPVLLPGEAD